MKDSPENIIISKQIAVAIQAMGLTAVSIHPIGKGGSARSFFRVYVAGGGSFIFIAQDKTNKTNKTKEENAHYAPLADFLRKNEINVPLVHSHGKVTANIVMQDLGDNDLYAQRFEAKENRLAIYKQTLMEIHKFHNISTDNLPPMMPPFDEATFQWEREYFWEHFIRPLALAEAPKKIPAPLEAELANLANHLLSRVQTLIHRDLQSQNVMLCDGKTYLIDFQGMRLGNPLYDVASLLFDPYVAIDEAMREHLFAYYQSLSMPPLSMPPLSVPPKDDLEMLLEAALERLLQALGAYGFLSLQKGKLHFLEHIPRAIDNLQSVLERLPQYPQTARLINAIDKNHLQQQLDGAKGNDKAILLSLRGCRGASRVAISNVKSRARKAEKGLSLNENN